VMGREPAFDISGLRPGRFAEGASVPVGERAVI